MIEEKEYQEGTRRLAEMILDNRNADKIVGGGDTIAFINKLGLTDKFNWVSTGGGSMLKFLSGEKLPGIEALIN
jgi:phosphoglycerate kinase